MTEKMLPPKLGEHAIDTSVLEPFVYIGGVPGKDIRGKLIDCFQQWLKIPEERVVAIKTIVTELHQASLLVDDIEDGSKLRRGQPVAHAIYGIPSTLNCANYVYFIALKQCQSLGNAEALNVFIEELLNLHRGQGQDIVWRDANTCPTEEQYVQMVLDKTGGLFRLAVGLMAAFSTESHLRYHTLVDRLALYFQIRDDFVNLRSDEYMHSKSYCEDITEGKFSFPIIRALRSRPNDTRLLAILKQRTNDTDLKRHAIDFMENTGAFEYTRTKLRSLRAEIDNDIALLGGHHALTTLIDQLDRQLDPENPHDLQSTLSTKDHEASLLITTEEKKPPGTTPPTKTNDAPALHALQRAPSDSSNTSRVDPLS